MKKDREEKEDGTRRKRREGCVVSQTTRHRRRRDSQEAQSTLKTRKQQKGKLKKVDLSTKPEDILETFQNRDLVPAEWEHLAHQMLKRGVQKVPDELRGKNQSAGEGAERFYPPTVVSDDSNMEDMGPGDAPDKRRARNTNVLATQSSIR